MTTYAPEVHVRRPHVSFWLVAVIALAAALVALGAWVIVDRYTGPEHDATTLIDDFAAAFNAGDANALAALMTKDVAMRSLGDTAVGRDTIANGLAAASADRGVRVERVAPVTVEGDFATTFNRYTEPGLTGTFLAAFQLEDGKILRIWGFEPGVTPPFDNAVMP